ncbi:hypothetical protein ZHAS_00008556 [Anopheles sinensis]|uniref:Uncharacterized protein n=1 Tax=Anopheles sinensis TaxID=74873 RepID=A0A084VT05_ANOSI|nr:hypothetical protein ZHAS_00008556 [Anopheles sinensis]
MTLLIITSRAPFDMAGEQNQSDNTAPQMKNAGSPASLASVIKFTSPEPPRT